jgi:hypothetical protein
MAKAMKNAMTALYQNGERLRPSNGSPVRLQWLRRIKVTEGPTITRDETHITRSCSKRQSMAILFSKTSNQ